jgi:hypothetical protein
MSKSCFVIGPIGEPGSTIRTEADDFMKYIVSPVLEQLDYGDPIRADRLNEPGRITSQVIKLLLETDLVIADLTTNNANVYYELSVRHAIGKPAIHMALEGTPLSFDLRDNRTIFYTMHSRIAEIAREELSNQIKRVQVDGYKPTNPIVETTGIIKLEQSTDPNQNAIGQLMSMIEDLRAEFRSTIRDVHVLLQTNNNSRINAATTTALAANASFSSHARSALLQPTLLGSIGVAGPSAPPSGVAGL